MKMNQEGTQAFGTEACLVECFVGLLQTGRTQLGPVQVATEWDHRSGFVDVLARDASQSLFAFEAKLTDWRRAFHQAYRNTAYANRAYVMLPARTADRALRAREDFELRGVGLCSFDGKHLTILIEAAEQQDPLLKWIRERAHNYFNRSSDECHADRPQAGRNRGMRTARLSTPR